MTQAQTLSPCWITDCHLLRCVACGGRLEPAADDALACLSCPSQFPIRAGVLDLLGPLAGNNKIAADFYDGPLWPKFRFWEWLTFFLNGGEHRARGQILQHLPHLSGTRLLDVAIGDGPNLPLVPPDCLVFGNDISAVQLANCRRKHPGRDLRLFLGEAERLPFGDATFDNVLSIGAFNYFNDPLQALREMARVVQPGGLVVVADEVPDLPNRLIGHRLGWPQLDRWIMADCLKLGREFTGMVDRHRDLKLEPIVRAVLDDWQIHPLWRGVGYCVVGRPK
jgi:SAM-dependent methyltransferase